MIEEKEIINEEELILRENLIAKARKEGKDPMAVLLGHRGGKKGGLARSIKLTKARRREIAMMGVKARWGKEE